MLKLKYLFLLLAFGVFFSKSTYAKLPVSLATPIGLGMYPPAQFPSPNFTVQGLRLSALMGENREMHGIDIGLIGNSTGQDFSGLAVSGLFNWNQGETTIFGLQLAGVINLNQEGGRVYGVQLALVNQSQFMDIYGVQIGLYNRANSIYGFQVGLFNYTNNLHGLQIGLANYNEGGPFRVSPLINFGF